MPTYELSLTLKTLSRPELISTLKRTAEMILDNGGILRQFISLGTQPLPYRMRAHNAWHREGSYFVMKFDSPPSAIATLTDNMRRDIDIIRQGVFKKEGGQQFKCTLEEELKPPAYRKDVEQLVKEGRKVERPMFRRNAPGFDFNPFQK
nr:EOG090X0IQO [Leptodora kindtii]